MDASDPLYQPLVLTAAWTGCRWGELAGLRRDNVDVERGRFHVRSVLTNVRADSGRLVPGLKDYPKSDAGRRTIGLPSSLTPLLRGHVTNAPASPYLFTCRKGTLLRESNFYRRHWSPAVQAVGLEPLTFHDLRHTHVALLIHYGWPEYQIVRRLGWADSKMLHRVYGHLFPNHDADLVVDLDARLRSSGERGGRGRGAPPRALGVEVSVEDRVVGALPSNAWPGGILMSRSLTISGEMKVTHNVLFVGIRVRRLALAVLALLALSACGGGGDDAAGRNARPSESAPGGEAEPILIKTRVNLPTIKILNGSTIGDSPFCPGGTAQDKHGTPEIGLVDRTIRCSDGTLRMGFDPQEPVGDTQSGPWRIISGTGVYQGWEGSGEMKTTYDPSDNRKHPTRGRETFTGTVTH